MRKDLEGALDQVQDALHKEFKGDAARARLEQFDSHLASARMVIGHLFEESLRMENFK